MDPVLAYVTRGVLALVLLVACAHKLREPRAFVETLRGYEIVPRALAAWVAIPVVAAELALGIALLVTDAARVATLGAVILLLTYAAAISVNLIRGRRDIDCGCSGAAARQSLSGWLVLRNLCLAAGGLASLAPTSPRALGAMDLLTIVVGVGVLYTLYAAANLLLAYAPRTKALLG